MGVFGLIWLFFSIFTYPENPQLLSIDTEEKLGESYLDLVLLNPMFREFENEKIDSAIKLVGDRLEADLFAAQLLEHSGIEPRILATLFRKLENETDKELMKHFEIVSTHPNFSSRIREALSYTPAEGFEEMAIELDWDEIRCEL